MGFSLEREKTRERAEAGGAKKREKNKESAQTSGKIKQGEIRVVRRKAKG